MTPIELAQDNVRDARVRMDLLRSFVQGSRLTDEKTASSVRELHATFEQTVRLYEDHWEQLLREEDRRSTLHIVAASTFA